MSDEAVVLLATLDSQRQHVLGILDGLSDEDLRRPVLPSGWTCLGLVQHLALDVEHFWFERVIAGRTGAAVPSDPEDAWQVGPEVRAGEVLGLYRRQIELANAVINDTPLDAAPAWWPEDLFGTWRLGDLRQVILHVIAETACHAGHLDAARELIDGRTWLRLN
jgi:uncharacterized damage-inducible protein DinB